jgi:uncharacterized membrane protein YdbT with pleckstrin-like domain
MSNLSKHLSPDEKCVYATRIHWVVFSQALVLLVATFLAWSILPGYLSFRQSIYLGLRFDQVIVLALFIACFVTGLRAGIQYLTSWYVVTNRRVLWRRGLLIRQSAEVLISRIESVSLRQSLMGQLFNYASLTIIGTGGSIEYFIDLPNPAAFQNALQSQLDSRTE